MEMSNEIMPKLQKLYIHQKRQFFANSNIPLPKWLHLMYLWATKASNKHYDNAKVKELKNKRTIKQC